MLPKKSALGRGLEALIEINDTTNTKGSSVINEISLSLIDTNPDQPRKEFDPKALEELSESIMQFGVISPITLRQMDSGRYQIIAGERRFRASKLAGLETIPAYIRTATDETLLQMALIENVQREDLNAIEVSLAYQNLINRFGMTQEELSQKIGKKRATIANYIRLLRLPAQVQMGLRDKQIEMGHARALLAVESPVKQLQLYNETIQKGWSVREVENRIRKLSQTEESSSTDTRKAKELAPLSKHLTELLQSCVKTKVKVKVTEGAKGKGNISISYKNTADLEKITALLESITDFHTQE